MSIKTSNKILPDLSKLEPLDGTNYRRWSQKLLIFFEQLEVDYVLTTDLPTSDPPTTTSTSSDPESSTGPLTAVAVTDQVKKDQVIDPEKYAKDNKTVRGHLLNHMSDPMFDLFVVQNSAKDIWSTLESRYGGDDAGRKKYVVGKWLQFQMTDDKPVVEQIHEYENLVANVLSEGMKMCEILQANVLLEKFPPSWNDYRNHLKHKKKDLRLPELISHMCTEEANRLKDNLASQNLNSVNANLVESSFVNRDRTKQEKGHKGKNSEKRQFKTTGGQIKKKKLVCYVCRKEGHKSYQCNQRKGRPSQKPTPQANLAEQDSEIIAAIVEANLIENKTDWILDTGASRHFCTNRLEAMWIVTSLSQYITASEGDEMYRSFINCFIQVSSLVVVARARYSAFTEDRETIDCYFTFQDIKASPMNMQKPMECLNNKKVCLSRLSYILAQLVNNKGDIWMNMTSDDCASSNPRKYFKVSRSLSWNTCTGFFNIVEFSVVGNVIIKVACHWWYPMNTVGVARKWNLDLSEVRIDAKHRHPKVLSEL
ncbi:ty1-copia retrotransposon protein [Cucumis melo var. makuwa]|uniref:Ty1-copia retrotransposon protein n=1 Tax=Cucumis melo var. makuwa TaxID=1194695 RepID=A0A5A7V1I1_CUCMM|nr:ty1-copia retrotransposon protein [Cucumis melo var. makuwa]